MSRLFLGNKPNTWRWFAYGVFALALFLRLSYLLQIEHNVDHAYYIGQALRTLEQGEFPIVGQRTSLQFPNSAFLGYVYAPILWLFPTILAVYVFVIALNTLAVYFTYRVGAMLFHPFVGVVASFLMAVNPWVIEYSRSTWSYSFMLFTLTGQALLLWRVILGRSRAPVRDTVLASVFMTITTQVTLTGYFILPATLLTILFFWQKLPKRGLAWGALIFAVPTLVFALGVLAQWQTTSSQLNTFLTAGQGAYLRLEAWAHALRFVNGADYELQRGLQAPIQDSVLRHHLTAVLSLAISALVMWGALQLARDAMRSKERTTPVLLAFWGLVPTLLMSYNSALVHPFYLLMTIPSVALVAGYGAWQAWQQQALRWVVLALVTWAGLLFPLNSARYYQETAHLPSSHGLDALSLEWGLRLGASLGDGVVYADVEGWILNSFAGKTFPVVNRVTLDTRAIYNPNARYVTARDIIQSLFRVVRLAHLEPADGGTFSLYRVDEAWQPEGFKAYPITGEMWLDLLGYRVIEADGARVLDTYWQVKQTAGAELFRDVYTPTAHAYDTQGNVKIVDGQPLASYLWTEGDVHAYRLILPDQPLTSFSIGFYDGIQAKGLTFILADGTYTQLIPLTLE